MCPMSASAAAQLAKRNGGGWCDAAREIDETSESAAMGAASQLERPETQQEGRAFIGRSERRTPTTRTGLTQYINCFGNLLTRANESD